MRKIWEFRVNSATAGVRETQKYELKKGNYMLIAYEEKH